MGPEPRHPTRPGADHSSPACPHLSVVPLLLPVTGLRQDASRTRQSHRFASPSFLGLLRRTCRPRPLPEVQVLPQPPDLLHPPLRSPGPQRTAQRTSVHFLERHKRDARTLVFSSSAVTGVSAFTWGPGQSFSPRGPGEPQGWTPQCQHLLQHVKPDVSSLPWDMSLYSHSSRLPPLSFRLTWGEQVTHETY